VNHPTDALLSLVYGELAKPEADAVQAHVDGCPECAATVAGYRAVQRAAAALPRALKPTVGPEALLRAATEAAAQRRRRRAALRASTFLTGAGTAAFLLLVLFLHKTPGRDVPAYSAPSAVGPLAQADVPRAKTEGAELDEKQAPERRAPVRLAAASAAPRPAAPRGQAAAASSLVAEKQHPTDVPAPSAPGQAGAGVGAEEARPAPQKALGAAMAKRAESLAQGPATAPRQAMASDRAAENTQGQLAAALAGRDARPAADEETPAARQRDEARRAVLLSRLASASLVEALPLLSELCTLEVRLALRADGLRTCTRVVEEYPGTAEADAARLQLQRLGGL
jgi:Putative zinc-finger